MSFNIKAYMADIDREIIAHRQEIAKRRLRISELEDTRVLMQQREEYRAEINGEVSPFGQMPPGVEIAVRQQRMLSDEGVLSHALKTGALPPPTEQQKREVRAQKQRDYRAREMSPQRVAYKQEYNRKKAEERRAANPGGLNKEGNRRGMGPKKLGLHARYKGLIIAMLKTTKAELNMDAIVDRLNEGPKVGNKARQPVYQALYELRRDGLIESPHGHGTYSYKQPPSNGSPQ